MGDTRRRQAKVTLRHLLQMKRAAEPISALGVYDSPMAAMADPLGFEMFVIGNSGPMCLFGHTSSTTVTADELLFMTQAVSRVTTRALVVATMPYMSYLADEAEAIRTAGWLVAKGGANCVQCHGTVRSASKIAAIVDAGVPVLAHLGLQSVRVTEQGGFGVQGRRAADAARIVAEARAMVEAGVFALILELVPVEVTAYLRRTLPVPVISLGSGVDADGVYLVGGDLVGHSAFRKPRNAGQFCDLRPLIRNGLQAYRDAAKARQYPPADNVRHLQGGELARLRSMIGSGDAAPDKTRSAGPATDATQQASEKLRKIRIQHLAAMKQRREPIVALGVYDTPTAAIADEIGIEILMTGPSGPMSLFGHTSPTSIGFEEQLVTVRAVTRTNPRALTCAHMPYMSYHASCADAVRNAARLVIEGGVETVKCDANRHLVKRIRAIARAGIPVIGHIGLQASRVVEQSGFALRGADADSARLIVDDARALVDSGVFALVLEHAPAELGALLAAELPVPVISLAAGADADGVALISGDAVNYSVFPKPRGASAFVDVRPVIVEALTRYRDAVRNGSYPADDDGIHMSGDEAGAFMRMVE